MARREDQYNHHHNHQQQQQQQQQHQIHYTTILPPSGKDDTGYEPRAPRKQSALERAKALYVDFEDAFQDETTNHDYFGFQPPPQLPHLSENASNTQPPLNFYLQSVETISEVKNSNFSPNIRYYASRENSRPSTPSDTPPYQLRFVQRSYSHLNPSASNGIEDPSADFANLNLMHANHDDQLPAPFTPDAIRLKQRQKQQQEMAAASLPQTKLLLPQYFLVKYLGRTACTQIWGAKAVRGPIDAMVHGARQLLSLNELPTLEASVNTRGLTLTHRQSPTRSKHQQRAHSPERHQHGLIPLENISYVMHDIKYSKVSACIVLRQSKTLAIENKSGETLTECYSFLFQSKEHAQRFALSLAEAFNVQKQSSRTSRPHHEEKREGRSPQRRSRHRTAHQQDKTRATNRHDDAYLRDSEV